MKQKNNYFSYFLGWLSVGLILGLLFLIWQGDVKIPLLSNSGSLIGNQSNEIRTLSFSSAIKQAAPAVVTIKSLTEVKKTRPSDLTPQQLLQRFLAKGSPHAPEHKYKITTASGVIISTRGYVLTNFHAIAHRDKIQVLLNDGRTSTARLIGSDPDTDLAVLKINLKKLPTITIGDSEKAKVGDIVLAIGDPFAIGQTVTQGIISATGRTRVSTNAYENFLQTDAAINPGNSGGALINTSGEIIGINSNIYTNTGNYQGISFAIPIHMAQQVFNQIIKHGYVIRGWLGVEGQEIPPHLFHSFDISTLHGILITEVDPDGPGDKAGLKPGDIITKINQKKIYKTRDIMKQVAAGKPGDIFRIEGIRKRQSFMTKATLGQRPLMSQ